jgi:hypothetical protein
MGGTSSARVHVCHHPLRHPRRGCGFGLEIQTAGRRIARCTADGVCAGSNPPFGEAAPVRTPDAIALATAREQSERRQAAFAQPLSKVIRLAAARSS